MAAKTLQELFVEELHDMYDGERQLRRALPKMAKAANADALREAFTSHLKETENQITRLDQVFRSIGETARGKKCEVIEGIVEEGRTAMEELDGAILDAALIAGAQRSSTTKSRCTEPCLLRNSWRGKSQSAARGDARRRKSRGRQIDADREITRQS